MLVEPPCPSLHRRLAFVVVAHRLAMLQGHWHGHLLRCHEASGLFSHCAVSLIEWGKPSVGGINYYEPRVKKTRKNIKNLDKAENERLSTTEGSDCRVWHIPSRAVLVGGRNTRTRHSDVEGIAGSVACKLVV